MDTPDFQLTEWTHRDTMDYLTANPLPVDFVWRHRDDPPSAKANKPVHPKYVVEHYGKWLHDTPYFPGLFELIHDILFHAPTLPSTAGLVEQLVAIRREREGQQTLF
jgi:hypothetical protein